MEHLVKLLVLLRLHKLLDRGQQVGHGERRFSRSGTERERFSMGPVDQKGRSRC